MLSCVVCLSITSFSLSGVYREVWSESNAFLVFFKILLGSSFAHLIVNISFSFNFTQALLSNALISISLLTYRGLIRIFLHRGLKHGEPIAIYGAGAAGIMLNSLLSKSNKFNVVLFIDDDEKIQGRYVSGVPIFSKKGAHGLIASSGVKRIVIAMPSVSLKRKREIMTEISSFGTLVMTVPPLEDIIVEKTSVDNLSNLEISELLGRSVVQPNESLMRTAIQRDDVILVTGAGGSIGSEISNQICKLKPKVLILIDTSEHALYQIERKLRQYAQNTRIVARMGSVCDKLLLSRIISEFKITTIFHAAAYKHVPLVENNITQAIQNNILGTALLVELCEEYGIGKFILVSTDKAVRPTNVMGATKRVCEIILQSRARLNVGSKKTVYSMVRFGNVLGSSGSVVPLFREQIQARTAITLTDKEITRYFMSVQEAAQLVIQSAALAKGGDIFVLEMGEPVKIYDLALLMVSLAGLTVKNEENPDGDIEMNVIGLRPGEKLYEELVLGQNLLQTLHPKILVANEDFLNWHDLMLLIDKLRSLSITNDDVGIVEVLKKTVEGFDHRKNN